MEKLWRGHYSSLHACKDHLFTRLSGAECTLFVIESQAVFLCSCICIQDENSSELLLKDPHQFETTIHHCNFSWARSPQ